MTITRRERRRLERWRHRAVVVGCSFAAGALVDTAMTWRLHEFDAVVPIESRVHRDGGTDGEARQQSGPATAAQGKARDGAGNDGHAAVSGTTGVLSERAAIDTLTDRDLIVPVEGVSRSELRDTFSDNRSGGRTHEALDIMAPRGTPVRAVEDGTIARLFDSEAGGLTVYQFDPSGRFCYYYAHLDRYANGLKDGERVDGGDVIGYVGSTGNASPDAPHLHFAVFRLGPERLWWKGEPINPYPVFADD